MSYHIAKIFQGKVFTDLEVFDQPQKFYPRSILQSNTVLLQFMKILSTKLLKLIHDSTKILTLKNLSYTAFVYYLPFCLQQSCIEVR